MSPAPARPAPEPVYFPSAAAFGRWLATHHAKAAELWVGYRKVGSGKPSLTWSESVDEALYVGWIDGIRRSVDATRLHRVEQLIEHSAHERAVPQFLRPVKAAGTPSRRAARRKGT